MNKYNGILKQAADDYRIIKGKSENETDWKSRIIYSILGRMALASLFDMEDEDKSSVVHMKRRVENLIEHYREMYPELDVLTMADSEELSNEIYDIYLHTGAIYHEPNRVILSAKTDAVVDGIKFTRGYEIEAKQFVSGLGTYMTAGNTNGRHSVSDMYQLENIPLLERWDLCIKNAKWTEFAPETSIEYLRTVPSFRKGYWVDKPDESGKISILRTGFKSAKLYYLYKAEDEKILASQLPQWQVEDYNYRSLANACLCQEGVLPPSRYRYDGELVYLKFEYLPPPIELYFWKLYSWPSSVASIPSDFNRVLMRPIFEAIKTVMEQQGYEFVKE